MSQISISQREEVTINNEISKRLRFGPNLFEQITGKSTEVEENHLVSIKKCSCNTLMALSRGKRIGEIKPYQGWWLPCKSGACSHRTC